MVNPIEIITNNPHQADELARQWNAFVAAHQDISHFQNKAEFEAWARTHNIGDTSVWIGKEIQDSYFYLRDKQKEQHVPEEERATGSGYKNVSGVVSTVGFLAALYKEAPKRIEDDPEFKKILAQKEAAWLEKHPGKTTESKEWVDYKYGSMENPEAPTLHDEAEIAFREDKKFGSIVKRYDAIQAKRNAEIKKDPSQDVTVIETKQKIEVHTEALFAAQKKENPNVKREDIQKKVTEHHWEKFVEKHPEKTEAYLPNNDAIMGAYARRAVVIARSEVTQQSSEADSPVVIARSLAGADDAAIFPRTDPSGTLGMTGNPVITLKTNITPIPSSSSSIPVSNIQIIQPVPKPISTPPLSQARATIVLKPPQTPSPAPVAAPPTPSFVIQSRQPQLKSPSLEQPPLPRHSGEEPVRRLQNPPIEDSGHASPASGVASLARMTTIQAPVSYQTRPPFNWPKSSPQQQQGRFRPQSQQTAGSPPQRPPQGPRRPPLGGLRNPLRRGIPGLPFPNIGGVGRFLTGISGSTVITVVLIVIFTIIIAAIGPEATTGLASPDIAAPGGGGTGGINGNLNYAISFRNTSILPENKTAAQAKILQQFPSAKLEYWDTIVQQSIANGWNPAFVLALWAEETGSSQTTVVRNGGSGIGSPGNLTLGHLGCAPREDQTINESLRCLFQNFSLDKYPNEKFADFMCVYGGDGFHPAPCVFERENPNFPPNLKKFYMLLVPSGQGLSAVTTTTFNPVAAPSPSANAATLRGDILNRFKISFNPSFDANHYNYLKWAWEVLWSTSNTNFLKLVNPFNTTINVTAIPTSAGFNEQYDCVHIGMRLGRINPPHDPYDEQFFKIIFTHELGHLIENCNHNGISRKTELDQIIKQEEGYITNFAKNSGAIGDNPLNEDYAESLAYFINPSIPELKLDICSGCNPTESGNPYTHNKPLHKQFVQDLLGIVESSPTPSIGQEPIKQGSVASCPIPNGRIICPSYGKIASGEVVEDPTCVSKSNASTGETDIGGHCGPLYREKYPELCTDDTSIGGNLKPYISGGNLRRTAKSIDIVNQSTVPGQEVFLPTIKGQILKWSYKGVVPAGGDYGFIRLFESEPTLDGIWSLHYTHVNSNNPLLSVGAELRSGQVAATLIKQTDIFEGDDATHIHFTIGLNVGDSTSDLKNYSPGWKFPDRELGMCTN